MISELRQEFAAALFVDCGNVKNVIAAPLCTLGIQKKTHVPEMKKTLNIVENCVRKKLPTTICNLLSGNFPQGRKKAWTRWFSTVSTDYSTLA